MAGLEKRDRVALAVLLLIAALAANVALWFAWEFGAFGNWGAESGYYGQLNRVRHVLETMPGVTITNSAEHHDLSLEDFTFYLSVNGSNSVTVNFHEGSPQMRETDKGKLKAFIEKEIIAQAGSARVP